MEAPIYIVGVGPGSPDYLTPAARRVVEGCDLLVGGERALALFSGLQAEKWQVTADLEGLVARLRAERGRRRIAVLVSGDPGLYSLLDFLQSRFDPRELEVIPGISSVQLAFARLGLSWHGARVISLHGREPDELWPAVQEYQRVAVLLDHRFPPPAVARYLAERGAVGLRLAVCRDLSYPRETIWKGTIEEVASLPGPWENCLVVIEREAVTLKASTDNGWDYVTPGIPDRAFLRGEVPMTREEVRCLTLCKARLAPGHVVYDVGAGTGSLSVEAARLVRGGRVYAVERNPEAFLLVRQNAARFGLENLYLVEGEAPGALQGLPPADRVVVGGSGGRLREILSFCREKMVPGGRVVVNAVTLETLQVAASELSGEGWRGLEICCFHLARAEEKQGIHLWKGYNPVYVLTADLAAEPAVCGRGLGGGVEG